MNTITHTTYFESTDCCKCGVVFAVPSSLMQSWKASGEFFHCPNGHSQHFSKTEAQRLREHPLQDDGNWLDNTPEDQAKAVALERAMQKDDPNVFLHRSLVPIDQVTFDKSKQVKEPCDSGVCMV